jgi:ubiquinone/menaquinone biosynthesis C-methylase UbiE
LQSTVTSIPLPDAVADVVLLANVLHDIPDPTLAEAVRLLKPLGRLVNVDWKKSKTPGGPPPRIRLTPEAAGRRFARHGLRTEETWEFGPWHYALLLRLGASGALSPSAAPRKGRRSRTSTRARPPRHRGVT